MTTQKSVVKFDTNTLTSDDGSIYPSYTRLTSHYCTHCRDRYENARVEHWQQFRKEKYFQERAHLRAFNGVKNLRMFHNPIKTPLDKKELITLTPKQQARLDELMSS